VSVTATIAGTLGDDSANWLKRHGFREKSNSGVNPGVFMLVFPRGYGEKDDAGII
jgi:hypothetical protein